MKKILNCIFMMIAAMSLVIGVIAAISMVQVVADVLNGIGVEIDADVYVLDDLLDILNK